MPEIVGGLWITEYEFTRSFGVEPASASGKAVLGLGEASTGLNVGDYLAYSFGGIVFYGIVSNVTAVTERVSGREYTFQIVDNRVRLSWQWFFAQYNMGEEYDAVHARDLLRYPAGEFSSGSLGGGDGVDLGAGSGSAPAVPAGAIDEGSVTRGRIYRHRVPSQWAGGFSSYSTEPVSAADILRSAFKSAVGGFGYSLDLHSSMNNPVFDVDADNGMTLAALVAMINDRLGLQCTLDGSRTLRFERRGEGSLILPGPPVQIARDGESLSADPTRVRVVGDRTLVQVNNIPMEPDWARGWEAFVSEPAWLDAVDQYFGPFETTAEGRAELAARAREVTLREYIAAVGEDAEALVDYGRWGNVSRMAMDVWTYLNSIVFRSYRVGKDEELYGVPIRQLEVHDSLLCAVESDGEDAIRYRQSPVEFYPQAASFVLAKGQPLDLISVMDREAVVKMRQRDLREAWSEVSDFTFDPVNHTIRFAAPFFIDGDPAEGQSILLFPNKGEGGYDDISGDVGEDGQEYLRIVVPNPDYVITPAEIKCSMVFRLGPFYRDFGSGPRMTVHSAPSISEHLLDVTGSSSFAHSSVGNFTGDLHMPSPGSNLKEILFEDGKSAGEKADQAAEGLILKNPLERDGEYIVRGSAGTVLSGVIDRVTIRINRNDGIVETSEFAKPRSPKGFIPGRDIARRVRTEALAEGQESLRREVKMLRAIAKLGKLGKEGGAKSESHKAITDILRKPAAGGALSGVTTYRDINFAWPAGRAEPGWMAGDLVWLDGDGVPSSSGQHFAGVVVARPPLGSEYVTCAHVGSTVPTAVKPGLPAGSSLYASPGDWKASDRGDMAIGVLAHGAAVPELEGEDKAVMALSKLGSAVSADGHPWTLSLVRGTALQVAPGYVNYVEVVRGGTERETAPQRKMFIEGVMPSLEGEALDSDPPPEFDVSGMEDAKVWLVVRSNRCGSYVPGEAGEDERIEVTAKSEKPMIDKGETAVEIARLDLPGEDGSKKIKDVIYRVVDHWEQPYMCGGGDEPTFDESSDIVFDGSSVSAMDESDAPSGSGDEENPAAGCAVSFALRLGDDWLPNDCFPSVPKEFSDGYFECTPDRWEVTAQVTFRVKDPHARGCGRWRLGIIMDNSTDLHTGGVWSTFDIEVPFGPALNTTYLFTKAIKRVFARGFAPACGTMSGTWKAKSFGGPWRDIGGTIMPSCCGATWQGSFSAPIKYPVCGCDCYPSSPGDLDGDGLPNTLDPDIDGDGLNNPFDGDIDGDGILDEADPDMDGDGTPNESDPTPEGP